MVEIKNPVLKEIWEDRYKKNIVTGKQIGRAHV